MLFHYKKQMHLDPDQISGQDAQSYASSVSSESSFRSGSTVLSCGPGPIPEGTVGKKQEEKEKPKVSILW